MFVLVEDSAQTLVSSYVQVGDLVPMSDWWWQRAEGAGIGDALVGPVLVIEPFKLSQSPATYSRRPMNGQKLRYLECAVTR